MIYFDHAATTPMSAAALATYQQVAKAFYANSESLHRAGNSAGQLIQEAQTTIAQTLNLLPEGLIFTSGGTQSNQLGLMALAQGSSKKEILVSPLEHASVYQVLNKLAQTQEYQIKILPITATGQVTAQSLAAAITPNTGLIVIQAVNPITGICQNIAELNTTATHYKVPLFVDAVQGLTKINLDLQNLAGFSASGHKFNGPKGCGLLYLNPNYLTKPLFQNVFQQNGFLPGTLDTPGILSLTTALMTNLQQQVTQFTQLTHLKAALLANLAPTIKPVAPWAEFPGICGLLLPHTPGQEAVTVLGQQGLCFSTVSACSLKDPRPDATLTALGLSASENERYIRLSFGALNQVKEVTKFTDILNRDYA
ncbi:cysteine desulfurase family protein [Agrilactobacillus yilanensis]|uniref:Cysteine desulfurase family protein n=1 Tax=Agrilactobacillus yilanensis TaxID=2485997 RepID=A0ABW4J3T0_9LACO|nr:aminotransferase class V-fold PLP-dependent enzyme [Agrilactobacillus yilanensis]